MASMATHCDGGTSTSSAGGDSQSYSYLLVPGVETAVERILVAKEKQRSSSGVVVMSVLIE